MRQAIVDAIRERRRLSFVYEPGERVVVDPCLLGQLPDGDDALLCWQIFPPMAYGRNWRLLSVENIQALQVLDQRF